MRKRGRPPVLDDAKRREILAILAVGASRRAAARYVGCAPSTIRNTAKRDRAFGRQLERAQQQAELNYLKNIRDAAKKPQYWRAAAWVLERRNPEDFAPRKPGVVAMKQVHRFLEHFAQVVVEEVPAARQRQRILARIEALLATIRPGGGKRKAPPA
jgi:hypothetical protein